MKVHVTGPWSLLILTAIVIENAKPSTRLQRDGVFNTFDLRKVRRHIVCTNKCRVRKNSSFRRQMCGNEILPRMTQTGCKLFSDKFRKFNGFHIRQHNLKVFYQLTFKQCRMECLRAEVFCKAFEFHPYIKITGNCHLSSFGFMEVPSVYRVTNKKPWALLSRNCVKY